MRIISICLLCSFIPTFGRGQQIDDGTLKVTPSGCAEYRPADSKWLFIFAQQLLSEDWPALATSVSKWKTDPLRAQAAGLIILSSDNARLADQAIRPIMTLLYSNDAILSVVGNKAVEHYPIGAFYILKKMLASGSETAGYELTRFGEVGKQELLKVMETGSLKARRAAMAYLYDLPTMRKALDDPNGQIVGQAVRNLLRGGVDPDEHAEEKLLQDHRPKVRVAAAILAGRWSEQNWPLWVKLCHDPVTEIRSVAMLHMCALGLKWGNGPWVSQGIAAVGAGLHDKPRVRAKAIMAIRGWMLEWDKLPTRWSKADLAKAKAIIADPLFSRPILNAPKATDSGGSSEDREGIQMAQMLTTQRITKEVVQSQRR